MADKAGIAQSDHQQQGAGDHRRPLEATRQQPGDAGAGQHHPPGRRHRDQQIGPEGEARHLHQYQGRQSHIYDIGIEGLGGGLGKLADILQQFSQGQTNNGEQNVRHDEGSRFKERGRNGGLQILAGFWIFAAGTLVRSVIPQQAWEKG
jgi:hypothetical protein